MKAADIGLIGLAVMGENLALNMESKGFTVAVYNRTQSVTDRFIIGRGKDKRFIAALSLPELIGSLSHPRKVMLMIKAGASVDTVINQLIPLLSPGDVIIDGGNSDFKDSERRAKALKEAGLYFVGTGVSGGEEGALKGPSIMPGGSPEAWPLVKEILQAVSAKLDDGSPCCEWIGNGGAGHFVKMVHNGIEYGDMQLISEAYSLLKRTGRSGDNIAGVFDEWNEGELDSFLIEITADILRFRDTDGHYLLDRIRDVVGQKGTGKWSVVASLDENDPLTLITQAVQARLLSALSTERQQAAGFYSGGNNQPVSLSTHEIKQALYAAKLISYAQGFSLMRRASLTYGWNLDYAAIARIWRKGCIIRSVFLRKITEAYKTNKELNNLLFDRFFKEKIETSLPAWRKVVAEGMTKGVALPAMASAISYFDGLCTVNSAANLIQAQRDYFGAHTYQRTDRPDDVSFHTDWTGEGGDTVSGTYNV